MKIFVIKGMLKGIVKIDTKLHFVCDSFERIDKIILIEKDGIKVVEKCDFNRKILGAYVHSIVLLDKEDCVLATGSVNGKVDINKVMIAYRKIAMKIENNKQVSKPVQNKQNVEKNENKSSKIDTILQNNKEIVLSNDNSISVGSETVDTIESDTFKEKLDVTETDSEIEKVAKNIEENFAEDYSSQNKEDIVFDTQKAASEEEIFFQKNEDLTPAVDFILKSNEGENFGKDNYYAQIKNDLNKFFDTYPKNEELESKVWGSKWVRIKADYDYSVGVIFEDSTPSIIAYATPYDDYHQIDIDKLKFGEWLQLGDGEEDRRGYFVYYQNAQTGEMILNTDNWF